MYHLSFVCRSVLSLQELPTYLCLSDWYQPIHKTNFRTSIRSRRAARRLPCIATSRTRFINPIYKRPSVQRFCTLRWHLFRIPIRLPPPMEINPNIRTLSKVPFIFPVYISEEIVLSWSKMNCVYWTYINIWLYTVPAVSYLVSAWNAPHCVGRLPNLTTSDTENKTKHYNRSSLRSHTAHTKPPHTAVMKQFNAAPVAVPNAIRTRPISSYDVKCPTLAVTSWVSCLWFMLVYAGSLVCTSENVNQATFWAFSL